MELNGPKIVSIITCLVIIIPRQNRLINATQDCVSSLTNARKIKIDCNNRNLGSFPSNVSASTNILLLRNNQIKIIPSLGGMNLTQLEVLDMAFNDIQSLSNDTFRSVSQLDTLDLRYNPLFDYALSPTDVFRPLSVLKTLKLTCSMTSDLQKSLLMATTSVLTNLQQLYITGSTDLSAATWIAAQFGSLENLDLFDCFFPNISIEAMSPLRSNLKLKTISFRKCGIETIQEGAFSDLPHVESLSLACNKRIGLNEALNTLADFDEMKSNLSTVVLDHVENEMSSITLTKDMVCQAPVLSNIRRFALQSNHLIGFQVGFGNCLNNAEVLSIGYNVLFFQDPEYPGGPTYSNLEFMRLLPQNLVQLSMTHYFNDETHYLKQYCSSPTAIDVEIGDFFPSQPELDSEGVLPQDQKTISSAAQISSPISVSAIEDEPTIGYVPPMLKYLHADSVGMQRLNWSLVIPEVIFNPNNTFKYLNLSNWNMRVREIRGPLRGLEQLEVLDAAGLGVESVGQYWAIEMQGLRKINGSHNLLGKMAPDEFAGFCNGAANLEELDLSFNGLINISEGTLSELKSLKTLYLTGNQLTDLKLNLTYVPNLRFLSLAQNSLDTLSEIFTEQLDLVYQTYPTFTFDLRQNSFGCSCNNVAFVHWFQNTKVAILERENITCRQDWNLESNESIPIDLVSLEEVTYRCNEFRRFKTTAGLLTSVSFLIVLFGGLAGVLVYSYRWRLRWKSYLLRRNVQNYFKGWWRDDLLLDNVARYVRDAFVVCTDKFSDEKLVEWLNQTLPNALERAENGRNTFNLCIVGRDDPPEGYQSDVGCEILLQVKRVLIVLHPSCVNDFVWKSIAMLALTNRQEDTTVLELGALALADWPREMRVLVVEKKIVKRSIWPEGQDGQREFWNEIRDFLDNRSQQQA